MHQQTDGDEKEPYVTPIIEVAYVELDNSFLSTSFSAADGTPYVEELEDGKDVNDDVIIGL
ncbi:MAG: hypothetical protein LBR48_07375 [Dysgonamonadaceae bacterium]|jgi:hypothetical protein|nr:hypothetical protein [Dysgonamonadaceae bacterium]